MAKEELARLIEEAARLAEKAPKHLQEAAFNQAFQALRGETDAALTRPRSRARRAQRATNDGDSGESAQRFVDEISRTDYPEVGRASRLADKAMLILDIAHEKLGVDGLSPIEISQILSKKFRLPGRPNSIRMALVRETESVDDRDGRFHIMAGGERRVAELRSPTASESAPPRKKSTAKRTSTSKKGSRSKSTTSPGATARRKKATARAGGSGKGPKAVITDTISAGFFDKPRTASEIQAHLGRKKAHHFTGEQIRVALLRLVRDEELERDQNADGQYEYQKS